MKFFYLTAAALATAAVAEPIRLEKRAAKCVNDGFYNNFVQNAASASSFCATFYAPMATVKATTTATVTVTSTVKTVTTKATPPTVTTTTTLATATVTVTQVPPAKRDLDLAKRQQANFPPFIDAYESIQVTSACSCLLATATTTSTLTKSVTTVTRTTAVSSAQVTVTSTLSTYTTTVTTTSSSAASCPTSVVPNGGFESGLTPWKAANAPGNSFLLVSGSQYPCQSGSACGLSRGEPGYGGTFYTPVNTCAGYTYSFSAILYLNMPASYATGCEVKMEYGNALGNPSPVVIATTTLYDNTGYTTIQGTYTPSVAGQSLVFQTYCNNYSGGNIEVLIDQVSGILQTAV